MSKDPIAAHEFD